MLVSQLPPSIVPSEVPPPNGPLPLLPLHASPTVAATTAVQIIDRIRIPFAMRGFEVEPGSIKNQLTLMASLASLRGHLRLQKAARTVLGQLSKASHF